MCGYLQVADSPVSLEALVQAITMTCPKCDGAGWLWWYELDEYDGPGNNPHDCQIDDTRYTCDTCDGTTLVHYEEEAEGLQELATLMAS